MSCFFSLNRFYSSYSAVPNYNFKHFPSFFLVGEPCANMADRQVGTSFFPSKFPSSSSSLELNMLSRTSCSEQWLSVLTWIFFLYLNFDHALCAFGEMTQIQRMCIPFFLLLYFFFAALQSTTTCDRNNNKKHKLFGCLFVVFFLLLCCISSTRSSLFLLFFF